MPDINIQSLDGAQFNAYCAMPESGNGSGLIVIHEIKGVTSEMRSICDGYAANGYIAVCPNLFWRYPDSEINENTFDVEEGVRDLLAVLAHTRKIKGCNGKVGTVGFCLGSRLAFLMATRSDVDVSVCYYAAGIENHLDEIHDIREPLLLHMASLDEFSSAVTNQRITQVSLRNPAIKTEVYEGAKHAFASNGHQNYNAALASLANEKTNSFLSLALQN